METKLSGNRVAGFAYFKAKGFELSGHVLFIDQRSLINKLSIDAGKF